MIPALFLCGKLDTWAFLAMGWPMRKDWRRSPFTSSDLQHGGLSGNAKQRAKGSGGLCEGLGFKLSGTSYVGMRFLTKLATMPCFVHQLLPLKNDNELKMRNRIMPASKSCVLDASSIICQLLLAESRLSRIFYSLSRRGHCNICADVRKIVCVWSSYNRTNIGSNTNTLSEKWKEREKIFFE